MGQPGFVYVLSHDAMPGLVKIGMTCKSPVERASELATTGVPGPFRVEFAMWVHDMQEVERECHRYFDKFRHSSRKEFFAMEAQEAAIFIIERSMIFDGYSAVSWEVDSSLLDIGWAMMRATGVEMSKVEVCAALETLSEDELRTIALRLKLKTRRKLAQLTAQSGEQA